MRVPAFLANLAPRFDADCQAGGRKLLRQRRVRLAQLQPWLFDVRVRAAEGELSCFVAIGEKRALAVTCSCPRFVEERACGHAWAALLAMAKLSAGGERAPKADDGVDRGVGEELVGGLEPDVPAPS